MDIVEFSEMRIANAFKLPAQLTAADFSEMQIRCIAENKQWKVRIKRLEQGGSSATELALQRTHYKQKRWSERHISKAKKAALAAS